MWRKEPRSELNYLIQNLKGSVNDEDQKDYDVENKEFNKNARRDKIAFANQLAKKAEEAVNI